MREHGRGASALLGVLVCGALVLSACSSGPPAPAVPSEAAGALAQVPPGGKIGVILPDVSSSVRWETVDKPFLKATFDAAGIPSDIENANGDPKKFIAIGDQMIADGVGVMMIANLDSDSGAVVIRRAASAGISVIDYDRLTLGGGAKYYVSFDNVAVGAAMGQTVVKALRAAGKRTGNVVELNGAMDTDNNAVQFAQGYDKVIKDAGYTVIDSRPVAGWDVKVAATVFGEMFAKEGDRIDGVVAANDGLGGAAVAVLAEHGLAGKIPVTGQDATDAGLQRVLLGTQTMTVYKAIKREADAASRLAIAMIKGDIAGADAQASRSVQQVETATYARAVLLQPRSIDAAAVKDVVADRFTTAAKLCTTAALKTACARLGVS